MCPTITISEESFGKLQALAKPFVDTPESVIACLADAEIKRLANLGNGVRSGEDRDPRARGLNPDSPESLTHTRLLSATVGDRALPRPKWNGVLTHLLEVAFQRLGSFEEVRAISGANLHEGKFEQNGYKFLPEVGFSLQGVDSNLAWTHSLEIARALKLPIEVRVQWRDKDGAAYPGEQGVLTWKP